MSIWMKINAIHSKPRRTRSKSQWKWIGKYLNWVSESERWAGGALFGRSNQITCFVILKRILQFNWALHTLRCTLTMMMVMTMTIRITARRTWPEFNSPDWRTMRCCRRNRDETVNKKQLMSNSTWSNQRHERHQLPWNRYFCFRHSFCPQMCWVASGWMCYPYKLHSKWN